MAFIAVFDLERKLETGFSQFPNSGPSRAGASRLASSFRRGNQSHGGLSGSSRVSWELPGRTSALCEKIKFLEEPDDEFQV